MKAEVSVKRYPALGGREFRNEGAEPTGDARHTLLPEFITDRKPGDVAHRLPLQLIGTAVRHRGNWGEDYIIQLQE